MKIDESKLEESLKDIQSELLGICEKSQYSNRGHAPIAPAKDDPKYEKFRDLSDREEILNNIASRYQAFLDRVPRTVFVSTAFKSGRPLPFVRNIMNWIAYKWPRARKGPLHITYGFSTDGSASIKKTIFKNIADCDVYLVLIASDRSSWIGEEFGMGYSMAKPIVLAAMAPFEESLSDMGKFMNDYERLFLFEPPFRWRGESGSKRRWFSLISQLFGSPLKRQGESEVHEFSTKEIVPRPPYFDYDEKGWEEFYAECNNLESKLDSNILKWLNGVSHVLGNNLASAIQSQAPVVDEQWKLVETHPYYL